MQIRDASVTLAQLYTARDNLLAGLVSEYEIGDRKVKLFDLKEINRLIHAYESAVQSVNPVFADLSETDSQYIPY